MNNERTETGICIAPTTQLSESAHFILSLSYYSYSVWKAMTALQINSPLFKHMDEQLHQASLEEQNQIGACLSSAWLCAQEQV